MKKNVIAIVAAVALVLLAVPTIAFANGMQQTWWSSGNGGSLAHHAVRAAGDSDAAAKVGAAIDAVRGEFVDRDSDGVCDNSADGRGAFSGYVDADNDGICDNYGSGAHRGCGNGCAYVDADNDGVCDNYADGQGNGYGCGNGYGRGNGGGHHGCMRR